MRKLITILTLWFSVTSLLAQTYPKNYFRNPVDGKILLAGTFGELRSYHFHMGIDIGAREGTPLKAAADGFLFRIKISESGYGKVMYINHPNGYTTVYAHMSRFTDAIEKFMHDEQYKSESEELDLNLPDTLFVFKKGEVIGYSGNTGHSAGPHLHFEIRDTKTEDAINPLLFGIAVKDAVKPTIQAIKVYPMDETSSVEGKADPKHYSLKYSKSNAYKHKLVVKAYGKIAFAFQAHDFMSESNNRCGIYEISLHKGKEKLFGQRIARVGFDVSRFINVYKDYYEFHDNNRHIHKSFIKGNNKLQVYTEKGKDGIITIEGKDTIDIYVKVRDVAGNRDSVLIRVVPTKTEIKAAAAKKCVIPLDWEKPFEFVRDGIELNLETGTLYNSSCFHYYVKNRSEKSYSRIHAFYMDSKEPIQENFDVFIQPDTLIDSLMREKILIARTIDFKSITPYKTAYVNGRYAAQARSFGTFCLIADTVAPTIKPSGFKDSMLLSKTTIKELSFEIKDELSGIKSFKCFLNDKWILTHFHLKKNKMIFLPKEVDLPAGYYPIRVEALDEKNNKAIFSGTIKWE